VYDADGQLLTGSFMDYAIPRASDLPWLDVHVDGVPTLANRLGVKGAGQSGAIAAPQAVVAAVLDALRPMGIQHIDMPLTPERVWRALRSVL
jgi:carbon-monoxide dehydrogenase large subunit